MELKENRREKRFLYEMPGTVHVELRMSKEPGVSKIFDLPVNDCSRNGLGMVITQKDFDLLPLISEGDRLQDMAFFATWSVFKVNGTVTHKTKIEEGPYKSCYIMGIKSENMIGKCQP